ncbi:MAG: hypothetical protein K6A95_07135 [Bacteroidales bacterium]|nr:hypothetical protein [Bacteroidales bacterium]
MKKSLFFIILCSLTIKVFSQTPIVVADMSFKPNGSEQEELYYSFAEGDIIVVDLEVVKGKNIKSFEVIELPSSTKFSSFKPSSISQKQINVTQKGVYLFRIDAGIGGKVCNLKISRIPKNQSTERFNTGWKWEVLYDTTYTHYEEDSLIRYDTTYYVETVKEVSSRELSEVILEEKTEEIRSYGIINHDNPRTFVEIVLPQNQSGNNWEKKVVGWGYWLCVGNSNGFWTRNKELVSKSATSIAGATLGPIGALIAGGVSSLAIPDASSADNVIWSIVRNGQEVQSFMNGGSICSSSCLRHGNGPGASGSFVDGYKQGRYYICLYNDNTHDRIKVTVKVSALMETTTYQDVDYQRTKIIPKYVKVPKVRSSVSSHKIRVPVE